MQIKPVSQFYRQQKIKRLGNIISKPEEDLIKQCTLDMETLQAEDVGKRRVGQPRVNWLERTLKQYWEAIRVGYTYNPLTGSTTHGINPYEPLNMSNLTQAVNSGSGGDRFH